jgi:hypothetical protein
MLEIKTLIRNIIVQCFSICKPDEFTKKDVKFEVSVGLLSFIFLIIQCNTSFAENI